MASFAMPQPPQGEGILAKLGRFMTPQSPQAAGQMMVNPVGAVMPGMISEGKLVPTLLRILREKQIKPEQAETMLMDSVNAGKIAPDQFKVVYEALKRITQKAPAQKAREFAQQTASMAGPAKIGASIAAGGPEAATGASSPATSEAIRALQQKFSGGKP